MDSNKFIFSLTKLSKNLEKEFPKKKENIHSMKTFLYEIIENILPVNYDYNGKRIKLKATNSDNGWETILDALDNANDSLTRKNYEKLTEHLIDVEANAMDIALAVKTVRKNILKIVNEINKKHTSDDN
jgi:hypothetical protein